MRRILPLTVLALAIAAIAAAPAPASAVPGGATEAGGADFVPGHVLVRFRDQRSPRAYRLPGEVGVREAASALERNPRVAYAVPNYIARATRLFVPDDPGATGQPGGWRETQWNFLGPSSGGVNARRAWAHLFRARRAGGSGTQIAVIDTGVAFASDSGFSISPDFVPEQFAPGYDFANGDDDPSDENGHGTHVAGTIAEQVDNGVGVTGLAYGSTLVPIRVLNASGRGNADNVAAGIRWAAAQGVQVINLSLEFGSGVRSCEDVPSVCEAINLATARGALVVAAAGNDGAKLVSTPAKLPHVLSVGATTDDGCLANYSNYGKGLDLVAPGGGSSDAIDDGGCKHSQRGREICQLSFERPQISSFFLRCLQGTSQAAPHVAAVAALARASQVLGNDPSSEQLARKLKQTAHPLGPRRYYGAGLLDAGAATK